MSEISDPWIKIRESRLTKYVQDLHSAGRKFKSKYNFDPPKKKEITSFSFLQEKITKIY